MPTIFISYRRDDTPGYAGRLYDRLREEFGRDSVFIDVDALQPGDDFVDAIQARLEKCDLMLVVIGRRWLSATDDQGRPRLEDKGDYVRIEIETALERRLQTIPVLVERAGMPRLQDLPESLRALARRQAMELSDTRWEYDVNTLVAHLKRPAGMPASSEHKPERQPGTHRMPPNDAVAPPGREADDRPFGRAQNESRAPVVRRDAAVRTIQLRVVETGTVWNPAVMALSAVALGTAIIAPLQELPGSPTLPANVVLVANVLTMPLLLGIVLVRRDGMPRYRFLIATGFLILAARELSLMVPSGALEGIAELLRFGAYGCWTAAFLQRGVRLPGGSVLLLPYGAVAWAIVVMAAERRTTSVLVPSGPTTLALALMAWAAAEVWRKARLAGSGWAALGSTVWLVSVAYYWIASASAAPRFRELSSEHLAAYLFLADVAAWLIAMSVQPENVSRGTTPVDGSQADVATNFYGS